ncbi:MAG: hypothetical protein H6709_19805 [Kofleriaceae bacterium]|nr:hypothetical protein [Kofleriaceae bacterium]
MADWIESLDDARWDLEDDGREVRRELDRRVVERGGWATGAYLYQEREPRGDGWRAPRVALVRWKRAGDGWRKVSGINLTDAAQITALADALAGWVPQVTAPAGSGADDDGDLDDA